MAVALTIDELTGDYAFARSGDVVIHLWRAQLNGARLAAARKHSEKCRAALHRYALLTMFATEIGTFSPDISEEARTGVAELARWSAATVTAAAGVIEGTGFLPAMIRAAGNGVAMVARPAFPLKLFSTVPDSALWLSRTLRWGDGRSTEIVEAVEVVRAKSLSIR